MLLIQAKWYYYILLGLVDVEANFLGKYLSWWQIQLSVESIGQMDTFMFISLDYIPGYESFSFKISI
jgi:hypothetical protein